MKILRWLVWISVALAFLVLLAAGLYFLFNLNLLGIRYTADYLLAANSFFLLSIALSLIILNLTGKK